MSNRNDLIKYLTRRQFLAGSLGLTAGLLAGCGETPSAPTPTPTLAPTPTPALTQVADVFRVCLNHTPSGTIDPYGVLSTFTYSISTAIFDGLVMIDSAGHIIPQLAIAWER